MMKQKKARGKFSPSKKSVEDEINEKLGEAASEIKKVAMDVVDFGVGGAKISEKGVMSIGPEKAMELMQDTPRELTLREQQQRERDCKVDYSGLVPHHMQKGLDESRRTGWIPPAEVEKMPQWKPVLQPVVDEVIMESEKDLMAYMDTVIRGEKEKVVKKFVAKVLKKLPGHSPELVEKRVWGTLHALAIDQGVTNISQIQNIIKK